MGPVPVFIGKFTRALKLSLIRRLYDYGVRFFVRHRSRILAYTALRREIFITVTRNTVRSVNLWFREDCISPRTLLEYRKLQRELAAATSV
jgi:hypothetical protein